MRKKMRSELVFLIEEFLRFGKILINYTHDVDNGEAWLRLKF